MRVGFGEAADPFGGGGERDPVAGLAGSYADSDREVGFAGAGRPQKDDVVSRQDEVEGTEVEQRVSFQ